MLPLLGVRQKNGKPGHPQTQGKIERFHQTLKRWLAAQPPAADLPALQAQLDTFRHHYNKVSEAEPATLDGGDVLKFDGTVWVGQGGRTNAEGLAQLTELLRPFDVEVVGVPLASVLHLKSAVTALPDGTIIGYPPVVDAPLTWGESFEAVPEETGAHVVLLGGDTVLMAASAPQTEEELRDRGLDVVTVDISEFEKLEGCVTCLSVRVR